MLPLNKLLSNAMSRKYKFYNKEGVYLVSWNFKHIVNVFRIRGYNATNIKSGYTQLDIRSPKDIIRNEK